MVLKFYCDIRVVGQTIDGPENGQAPSAWDIAVQPSRMFFDHQKSYEVPHTASVKTCINCNGEGMNRCWQCLGRGIVSCITGFSKSLGILYSCSC